MSRRRRVIESESDYETEEETEDISEFEDSQSSSPLRSSRISKIRSVRSQNDSNYINTVSESDYEEDEEDHNRNRGNRSNRNNRNQNQNRNRNRNSDADDGDTDDAIADGIESQVLYDEAKNEIEGAEDVSSDDNKEDDSENDEEPAESHPNFSIILPSFISKLGDKYKIIDGEIEEPHLTQLIDTAQSLAEYNSKQNVNAYKQQTHELQTTMTKLLNLSKDIKIEQLMLVRVCQEIRDADNSFDAIQTGDWQSYLESARNNVSNEIDSEGRGRDEDSNRIKKFIADTTANYKVQFREAIQIDEIEDYDTDHSEDGANNRNRNRKRNDNENGSDDDDIDIVVDKSNKNVGSIKCPLTADIFQKPFKSKVCGHTFEKEAISKYILDRISANMRAECPLPGCSNILSMDAMIRDVRIERLIKAQSKNQQDENSEDEAMFDLTVPDPDR